MSKILKSQSVFDDFFKKNLGAKVSFFAQFFGQNVLFLQVLIPKFRNFFFKVQYLLSACLNYLKFFMSADLSVS